MAKKHPTGLYVLFFTELWERFGFYLMLGIFYLYMSDALKGGLAYNNAEAADIYGSYLALVYLTPFLGGLLADRLLGYRLSITIGGLLMGIGYLGLGLTKDVMATIGLNMPVEIVFFVSLLLIIAGNGFFKPNISTLVGNLYNDSRYKDNKDSGFNIFYMGINIGAFVCNFVAAILRVNYGWGYAFMAAGIGMFIGLVIFWSFQKHVKHADVIKPTQKEDMPLSKIFTSIFIPAIVGGVIGWILPGLLFGTTLTDQQSTDAFLFACIPVLYFYGSLWFKASPKDKEPIGALLSVFAVVIIFWAIFHQNGAALTLWAKNYTDREVPAFVEEMKDSPNDRILFTQEVNTDLREVDIVDVHGVPVSDANGNTITEMKPDPYFDNLSEEEWPEDGNLTLVSTEIFQSINPFFVVVLTPVVVAAWSFLRRRKKEPSTPAKIGIGMLITALSTTVMMLAVITSNNGAEKSSAMWLIMTYAVITIGELCLSPMGLALVSKLSPSRVTGLMMGGWFLATAIGNKMSGVISGLWGAFDNKVFFFMVNFVGAMIGAAMIFSIVKWLTKVVREHTSGS